MGSKVVISNAKIVRDTVTGETFIQCGCGDNLVPVGGGGGGTGGASSWADLKDKPFGETVIVKHPLIENEQATFTHTTNKSGIPMPYGMYLPEDSGDLNKLAEGDKVIIELDGEELEYTVGINTIGSYYFGDLNIIDGTGSEPLLCYISNTGSSFYCRADIVGEHTLSIYTLRDEVTRIEKEYLPSISWNDLADTPLYDKETKLVGCEGEVIRVDSFKGQFFDYYGGNVGNRDFVTWSGTGKEITYTWNIKEGDKLVVIMDGTKYEAPILYDDYYRFGYYIGNIHSEVAFDEELPFNIRLEATSIYIYMPVEEVGNEHEFIIYAYSKEVKKLDEKFVDRAVSWKDLNDKPFYADTINLELCERQNTLVLNWGAMYRGEVKKTDKIWSLSEDGIYRCRLKDGDKVRVQLDGVEYETTVSVYYDGSIGFGNYSLHPSYPEGVEGDDESLPFCIECSPTEYITLYTTADFEGLHEIYCYAVEPVTDAKRLATEFLPEHLHFGEKETTVFCVPEQTIQLSDSGDGWYYQGNFVMDPNVNLENGDIVKITIDGISYERPYDQYSMQVPYENGESGYCNIYCEELRFDTNAYPMPESMVLAVSKQKKEFTKMDEKYIPDTIARKSDISGGAGAGGGLDKTASPFTKTADWTGAFKGGAWTIITEDLNTFPQVTVYGVVTDGIADEIIQLKPHIYRNVDNPTFFYVGAYFPEELQSKEVTCYILASHQPTASGM